jgi:SAM-dependent methyltransferase
MQYVSQMQVRLQVRREVATVPREELQGACLELRCPVCKSVSLAVSHALLAQEREAIPCPGCSFALRQQDGIWNALPPQRQKYFTKFMTEYEEVRRAEARGSEDPGFYLSLPHADITGRHSWQWAIRARTYRYIARNILKELNKGQRSPASVLDLGAGNGWLSYRLVCLGYRPVAVDLLTNRWDGLGAALHYRAALPQLFPRFQAELDYLPFGDGQFDFAIFNASFHYSEKYERTLAEVIRCLRPGGTIVIADSPSYRSEESGQKMVKERQEVFKTRFGFKSDGMASGEYLTKERLIALEENLAIKWKTHSVWYGFPWAMRPWLAKLRRRREPSQFLIYSARVK